MSTVERAIAIAAEVHAGQTDKAGNIYVLHPLRLMLAMPDIVSMQVAVLHDVVEDGKGWSIDRLREEGFAPEVLDAVACLTHDKEVPYEEYIENISSNPIARQVKMADLEHNMEVTRLHALDEKSMRRLARYHDAWSRLRKEKSE